MKNLDNDVQRNETPPSWIASRRNIAKEHLRGKYSDAVQFTFRFPHDMSFANQLINFATSKIGIELDPETFPPRTLAIHRSRTITDDSDSLQKHSILEILKNGPKQEVHVWVRSEADMEKKKLLVGQVFTLLIEHLKEISREAIQIAVILDGKEAFLNPESPRYVGSKLQPPCWDILAENDVEPAYLKNLLDSAAIMERQPKKFDLSAILPINVMNMLSSNTQRMFTNPRITYRTSSS